MIKQVIVMRTDLGMRKGKMIAQGAYASVKCIAYQLIKTEDGSYTFKPSEAMKEWLSGIFTKIALKVKSEKELMEIFINATNVGLPAYLIVDAGKTEFHGVPTVTCISIGPAPSEEIDKITGHLDLL